jgi:hypothetical protein
MKFLNWISNNILFLIVLFLLAFIPLYPKIPLLDVLHTWVYIRAEDLVIFSVLFFWIILLFRKKTTLKTPLTFPILLFWIVGIIATIHGVLLIFPNIPNVFPNLAFLSMLRRIEYLSLFFVAYAAMKDKKQLMPYVIAVLVVTLLAVALYGLGQRYMGFPAYLTMNEEFAKGQPITLSALSRIPSTFGGHYDLAAYLVLVIPILASLLFGFRNWFMRAFLLFTIGAGGIVMLMTVSRISFFALMISLVGVFLFYKKRLVLFSFPFIAIIVVIISLNFSTKLFDRFDNTVKVVDVLVDARTGDVLGNVKEVTPSAEFANKIVKQRSYDVPSDLEAKSPSKLIDLKRESILSEVDPWVLMNLPSNDSYLATSSGIIPYAKLDPTGLLLVQPNKSTGENLPQGTGYSNLGLAPIIKRVPQIYYQQKDEQSATSSPEVLLFSGDFLVKRASAYDLSLTTRYQGEWPHAIEAFKRNIFLGSGYSSISLAIDNNFLRILGEVGLFGMSSFLGIFVIAWIYLKKMLPKIDSPLVKSFAIGFFAGVVGLMINATLIDVFEASKVAYSLWLLMGITIGMLHSYQTGTFSFFRELKKIATSPIAIIFYLGIVVFVLYAPMVNNFFVGDDFTLLRWGANAHGGENIVSAFTHIDGSFYRPGTKLYFFLLYSLFGLNPFVYHSVSLLLHICVASLVFWLAKKILNDFKLAVLAAFLFVILSGYSETLFWISSSSYILSFLFVLVSLLLFVLWEEKKKSLYFIGSLGAMIVSLSFHELGIIAPFFILIYSLTRESSFGEIFLNKRMVGFLFFPLLFYLVIRLFFAPDWLFGNMNWFNTFFASIVNSCGYILLSLFGPLSLPLFLKVQAVVMANLFVAIGLMAILAISMFLFYFLIKRMEKKEKNILIFSFGLIVISLIPFIGLQEITSRNSYIMAFGFVLVLAFLIKKIYHALLINGRNVAMGMLTVLLGLFSLLQIIQIQQLHGDWHDAGIQIQKFFVAVESVYENKWATTSMDLYFVNMPVKNGEAWVFPVGFEDALWFIVRNPQLHVYRVSSLEEAYKQIVDPSKQRVFVVEKDGSIVEKMKTSDSSL